jgi:hypothetical protein
VVGVDVVERERFMMMKGRYWIFSLGSSLVGIKEKERRTRTSRSQVEKVVVLVVSVEVL